MMKALSRRHSSRSSQARRRVDSIFFSTDLTVSTRLLVVWDEASFLVGEEPRRLRTADLPLDTIVTMAKVRDPRVN